MPDKKLNRRDFVAAGLGTAIGWGFFGLLPKAPSGGLSDGSLPRRHPASLDGGRWRLASPHSELKSDYDVIVVGSGYGGSILAARLAKPGRSVAVLERGKEWVPGDFPLDYTHLLTSQRSAVNPLGLLDWHAPLFSDLDIVCASGVGGTSLINAAIATRPEPIVFEQSEWPEEIRAAAASGALATYYDRVEAMLQPVTAPDVDQMAKVEEHHAALRELGVPFGRLRLNINHILSHNQPNSWGVPQSPCTSCGDCTSGCNVGAKNTLQANYLPRARAQGAAIFGGVEAEWVEKTSSGYVVHCKTHGDGLRGLMPRKISARTVILAAGSLGSTEIFLNSRAKGGLALSSALGTRFSTNGDVLGFSYNGDDRTNIVGYGTTIDGVRAGAPVGQAIMSYGDYRLHNASSPNIQDRFLLLDGTVPHSISNFVAKTLAAWGLAHRSLFTQEQLDRIHLDLKDPSKADDNGALNHSMLLLACGHDSSSGKFEYHWGERPRLKWPGIIGERFFQVINDEMRKHTHAHGGVYLENPRSTAFGGKRLMATHPLGGCPMGGSASEGVVDHAGRVFDPKGGFHDGLYVADGSMIPRSLAATPLMTISALSERIADLLAARLGG